MPWTRKQHRLFAAIAHGWKPPAESGIKISQHDAAKMAAEGVKGKVARLGRALKRMRR